jgi:hypothetical protein
MIIQVCMALVTALYLIVSVAYLNDSNYASCVIFLAYAIANVALYFAGVK